MYGVRPNSIVFGNASIGVQQDRKGQFFLFRISSHNFFLLLHINTQNNQVAVIELFK